MTNTTNKTYRTESGTRWLSDLANFLTESRNIELTHYKGKFGTLAYS